LFAMLIILTHYVIMVMGDYKKILLAVDFSEFTENLCQRAAMLSKVFNATVSYIHVVEPIILDMPYEVLPAESIELEQGLVRHAHARLRELAQQYGLNEEQIQVEMGSSKAEILRIAKEQEIDLIIIGSHGRHGIALLLGSTANAVLHGAPCDVLAVRIK
jgi:universal stress protein A